VSDPGAARGALLPWLDVLSLRPIALPALALLSGLLSGCPTPVQVPTPDGGRACVTNEDCNPPGATCGELYLCVQDLCEATPSQVVPCR
jgi:hypothetical protein